MPRQSDNNSSRGGNRGRGNQKRDSHGQFVSSGNSSRSKSGSKDGRKS